MRFLIVTLIFAIAGCSTKNKTKKQVNTLGIDPTSDEGMIFAGSCVFEITQKQENTYPFDKSDKIEIVSYNTRRDIFSSRDLIDNGKFAVDDIQQRMTLGKNQRDSIFSILFNLRPSPTGIDTLQADCYYPRHSIVFYEKTRAIAFFEVCLECGGTRQSSGVYFGQMCPEKLCILQKFFKSNGADFGIIAELCE